MQKLINSIKNYAWGSKSALTELYGIKNPDNLPMAELWIGAYQEISSKIQIANGKTCSLRKIIDANKIDLLGEKVAERFGELPFLFKVLCAEQPLSIQLHTSKKVSREGFDKENAKGVPIDADERNYKDPNHKPELVFALTPFLAMNGFREYSKIVSLLHPLSNAHKNIAHFINQPNTERFSQLFSSLLHMKGEEKSLALSILKSVIYMKHGEPWKTIRLIAKFYPYDSGLFFPLLLNVIKLNPGEAIFSYPETPHAYIHGIAIEVMANSDNVLRIGLTTKHIDITEAMMHIKFISKPANKLLTLPVKNGRELDFPIPVDDFAFSLHNLCVDKYDIMQNSAAILFCIDGKAVLNKEKQYLILNPGESAFISARESPISISGVGRIARVFNKF